MAAPGRIVGLVLSLTEALAISLLRVLADATGALEYTPVVERIERHYAELAFSEWRGTFVPVGKWSDTSFTTLGGDTYTHDVLAVQWAERP